MKLVLQPPDPIFDLNAEFAADKRSEKINGGIGVYLSQNKPYVLPVVRRVARKLTHLNYNYLPMSGDPIFLSETARLVLGKDLVVEVDSRLAKQGVMGGTNGLYVWGNLLKLQKKQLALLLGQPTWDNHQKIFTYLGFQIASYDHLTRGGVWNEPAFLAAVKKHPKTYLLLHGGSTHNPTGVNPVGKQWQVVLAAAKEYELSVCFDFAYMGLGETIEKDAEAVREFVKSGIPITIIISYSKNLSLYQHRTGVILTVAKNQQEREIVESNYKYLFRVSNSTPAAFGEAIAKTIFTTPSLLEEWQVILKQMVRELTLRRRDFVNSAGEKYVRILREKGLFSLLGLTPKQIRLLRSKSAIYLLDSSRINFGGMSGQQAARVGRAVADLSS